jgi:hypothetical protein
MSEKICPKVALDRRAGRDLANGTRPAGPSLFLALFLACTLWPSASFAAALPDAWHSDYTQASELARRAGKQTLVLFTGLKWDQWSQRLQAEVLDTAEFSKALGDDFVLTHVDLPEQPRPDDELNASEKSHYALARDLRLHVLPSLYLCTPEGQPYGLIGYRDGGPQALVREIRAKRDAYAALTSKAATLEGPARAQAIDAWLETLPEPLRLLQSERIQTIIDSDPDNSTGLRAKYRVMVMLPEARRLRYESRVDEAEKLYLEILREQRSESGATRQDLYYELADVYFQRKDYDALLDTLDRAISAAPEGPRMPVLKEMMDVFTRQWIYLKYDPEKTKAVDYDTKRVEIPPDGVMRLAQIIKEAKTVSPTSTRNDVLERMSAELTAR